VTASVNGFWHFLFTLKKPGATQTFLWRLREEETQGNAEDFGEKQNVDE